ncbi:hypothetical protein GGQ64_005370 [Rhizobium azooxidifex]|uniref:DNA-binding protein n=1 Tax=Mycoplana azooxidifex TaxID=1636188 RepID=A0A7W6DBE2_9HYPH|nr:hypothetical protein [Mycoplana azooxidifex]MBB3980123.1 hypothetical protein [Mycoplana azooxidifex]
MPDMKKTKTTPKRPAPPPSADELAPKLEAALSLSGMSQTRFGYIHFGDPTFFTKLRAGRRLYKLRAKAEEILEEYGI